MMARLLGLLACLAMAFAGAYPAAAARGDGVTVERAWARPTPGGSKVGAAYLEIFGDGKTADRLIGISSPVAGRAEIHTHIEEGGVMKMRKLDGLDIGPGSASLFKPGGNHIMLFDLKQPLLRGEALPLTLTFEKAGEVLVVAKVLWKGAKGPDDTPPPADASEGSESGSEPGSDSDSHSGSHESGSHE